MLLIIDLGLDKSLSHLLEMLSLICWRISLIFSRLRAWYSAFHSSLQVFSQFVRKVCSVGRCGILSWCILLSWSIVELWFSGIDDLFLSETFTCRIMLQSFLRL